MFGLRKLHHHSPHQAIRSHHGHEHARDHRHDHGRGRRSFDQNGSSRENPAASQTDETLCPLCDNNCPLSAPRCGKGTASAAAHAAE